MNDKMRARWILAVRVYEWLTVCAAAALALGAWVRPVRPADDAGREVVRLADRRAKLGLVWRGGQIG